MTPSQGNAVAVKRKTELTNAERVIIATYKHLLEYDEKFAVYWITKEKWKRYNYIADAFIKRREFTALEEKVGILNALYLYTVHKFGTEGNTRGAVREIISLGMKKVEAEQQLENVNARNEGVSVAFRKAKEPDEEKTEDRADALPVSAG